MSVALLARKCKWILINLQGEYHAKIGVSSRMVMAVMYACDKPRNPPFRGARRVDREGFRLIQKGVLSKLFFALTA